MRKLFAVIFIVLAVALCLTWLSEPDLRSEVPIIYWVIDPAPVRGEHIRLFQNWQVKSGHCTEHILSTSADVEAFRQRKWSPVIAKAIRECNDTGVAVLDGTITDAQLPVTIRVPKVEMRLDAASNDMSKKIVQSVSGIAGDVMEVYADGNVQFMASGGLAADVTDDAKRLGFGPEMTYPGLESAMMYNGRQYSFPRNPNTSMLWVNKDTFERFGQPLPPETWTFEEFEARGKAFVAGANPPGERRKYFFIPGINWIGLLRTMGVDILNETMTLCVLDDPRTARAMALVYKWTEEDHLIPTNAERASFATEAAGWGSGSGQLFAHGNYAMMHSGRYQLMQFRKFEEPIQLAVVEPPNGGIPCNTLYSGEAIVYRGSKHLDLAKLFLAFYASEDYSMQIVGDGDGLPPIPKYTETEEYRRPAEFPNEWGCHEVLAEDAVKHGVAMSFSPFIEYKSQMQCVWMASDGVWVGRQTPEDAAAEMQERVNRKIEITVKDNPKLLAQYNKAYKTQKLIEQYRSENRPVPRAWVTNPYHRYVYDRNGWLEGTSAGGSRTDQTAQSGTN